MADVIRGERLTTFDIEPDGSRFCMNVADTSGSPRGLSLPAECLTQLIMTLPEMAARLFVEASHVDNITIFTLTTIDGFAVSFGMTFEDLKHVEKTARQARTHMRPKFVKN
jgi:hypothetical protein